MYLRCAPAGHNVWWDEEADPGDDDEHPRGQVARDYVVGYLQRWAK